jgi:hypothetical protein
MSFVFITGSFFPFLQQYNAIREKLFPPRATVRFLYDERPKLVGLKSCIDKDKGQSKAMLAEQIPAGVVHAGLEIGGDDGHEFA